MDQPIEENSNLSSLNSNLSAFDSLDPDLQALVGDLAKRIYGGEEITFDSDLLHHTAKPLVDGLQKGYGKSLVEVEYNSPDYKALENLTKNAFKFSASKDFHILQDMTNALRDGDRVRSFDEFRAEVDKINVKYNQNWLRTEYNQAIAASQATARWQEFQDNAKAMPFLQYQAVMDSNTRPDHQRLHGVIKRIDNPFWNTHFPPLGWGCRCEVIQLPGKNHKETPDGSFQKPDVPPQFRENFGKKQQLFSDKHPYYQNKCQGCGSFGKLGFTPGNAQCEACRLAGKECTEFIEGCNRERYVQKAKENIEKIKEEIDPNRGINIKNPVFDTGSMTIFRGSFRSIISHNNTDEYLFKYLAEFDLHDFSKWHFERTDEVQEYPKEHPKYDPNNPHKKKHPDTKDFKYYSIEIGGVKIWANVKNRYDIGETLYTIEPDEPD